MKKVLLFILISGLLSSCATKEPENDEKSGLIAKRDSLKKLLEGVNTQLEKFKDNSEILPIVKVAPIKHQTFSHYFEVQGNVEADQNVLVNPEANGAVKSILVKEGQNVKRGDALLTLDQDIIVKSIQEVEKALELATFLANKQTNLWNQKIGSEFQYKQAINQKESLQSKLATLNAQKGKTIVRSPINGKVDEVFPKIGELVGPQIPAVRVVNLDKVKVTADITENYISSIEAGTHVELSFPSQDVIIKNLKVSRTGNIINRDNRTFKIQTDVSNNKHKLVPNMIAIVKIRDFNADSAIVVPTKIIRTDNAGKEYIFSAVKRNDHYVVKKKFIERIKSYEGNTMVTGSLRENELIVTEGANGVRNESKVKIQS